MYLKLRLCFNHWLSSEGPTKEMRERKKRLGFRQWKAMWALGFVRHIVVALLAGRIKKDSGSGMRTQSEGVVTADGQGVLLALCSLTIRGKGILTHSHRVPEADIE